MMRDIDAEDDPAASCALPAWLKYGIKAKATGLLSGQFRVGLLTSCGEVERVE
jgi:hypothetical protein